MFQLQMRLEADKLENFLNRQQAAHSGPGLATFLGGVIGPYLQERAKRRFRMEGDDASGPWMPLSETTHAFREAQGYSPDHPINHRTGRLERYVTGTSAGVFITGNTATLRFPKNPPRGETAAKLKTAQEGKARPLTPARPVLAVNEADMIFAGTALAQYIRTAGGAL